MKNSPPILLFMVGFVCAIAGRCEAGNRLTIDSPRPRLNDNTSTDSDTESDLMGGISHPTFGLSYLSLSPKESDQFEHGQGLAASWIGQFGDRYGAEVFVGHYQQDTKDGTELLHGKNVVWPVQVNIRYYPFGRRTLEPFVFGGGGYYVVRHKMDQTINEELQALGASFNEDISNSVGYQFGGGLMINIAQDRHLKIGLDYRYVDVSTTVKYSLDFSGMSFSGEQEVNLGGNMINAGMYYSF